MVLFIQIKIDQNNNIGTEKKHWKIWVRPLNNVWHKNFPAIQVVVRSHHPPIGTITRTRRSFTTQRVIFVRRMLYWALLGVGSTVAPICYVHSHRHRESSSPLKLHIIVPYKTIHTRIRLLRYTVAIRNIEFRKNICLFH